MINKNCFRLLSFFIALIYSCITPSFSQAESKIKQIEAPHSILSHHCSSFKFVLIGTFFSEELRLKFSIVTPDQELFCRRICEDTVIGTVKSSIRIKHVSSKNYRIILKNIADEAVNFIGGVVAFQEGRRFKNSHAIVTTLNPNEEVEFIFNRKKGFIVPEGSEHLLRWNPFDWLGG